MDLVAQIIGIIAMVVAVSSYQVKSQKGIVSVLIISTSLWTLHYFMKGLYVGSLLNLMCFCSIPPNKQIVRYAINVPINAAS